jgi:Mg2+/Co2+ transporter CorB
MSGLILLIAVLILLSGFFSISETSLMAVNPYKIRHLAQQDHASAKRVLYLLENTDKVLSVILIGNTVANIFASALVTLLGSYFYQEMGALIATFILTLIILVFAEIAPKTIAARYPQTIALRIALPIIISLKVLYPIIKVFQVLVQWILSPFTKNGGDAADKNSLSVEELKTLVQQPNLPLSKKHIRMLTSILELDRICVEDIMIPLYRMKGIDLSLPFEKIEQAIVSYGYSRLPVYETDIKKIRGMLYIKDIAQLLIEKSLSKTRLLEKLHPPYFIPENISLYQQLFNFQKHKKRIGIVVDEYGEVRGLLTLEDLLEEIVGDFTTDLADALDNDITLLDKNVYLIKGSTPLRKINRSLGFDLPIQHAKTLSGLITENLQTLPVKNLCLQIGDYYIEIMDTHQHRVKQAKVRTSNE